MRASRSPTPQAMAAVLAAGLGVTFSTPAWAVPFALDWSAPEGCPSRDQIVAAARSRLGETASGAQPELFVRGKVTVETGAFVVDLQVRDAEGTELGERHVRLTEPTCREIEKPTGVLVAMMIAVARPRTAAIDVPPDVPPAPAPSPAPPTEQAPSPPPRSTAARAESPSPEAPRIAVTAGASAVASVGSLPNVGFGAALRGTVTLPLGVVLGADGRFETSVPVEAGPGEATFRLFDLGLLAGFRVVHSSWLDVVPIASFHGGIMQASTSGFPSPSDATTIFVGAVSAGVLGRVQLGRALRLEVLPDVSVPLTRDEFRVRDRGVLIDVHRPAAVVGRISLGIAWEFR